MASTLDDEDLAISLPSFDRERHGSNSGPSPRPAPAKIRSPPATGRSPTVNRGMQRLEQYKIIRVLGEGSFGKVRLAQHRPTGALVALKSISRKKMVSRDMVGRVEREIQYLQLLRHPHIIKL